MIWTKMTGVRPPRDHQPGARPGPTKRRGLSLDHNRKLKQDIIVRSTREEEEEETKFSIELCSDYIRRSHLETSFPGIFGTPEPEHKEPAHFPLIHSNHSRWLHTSLNQSKIWSDANQYVLGEVIIGQILYTQVSPDLYLYILTFLYGRAEAWIYLK